MRRRCVGGQQDRRVEACAAVDCRIREERARRVAEPATVPIQPRMGRERRPPSSPGAAPIGDLARSSDEGQGHDGETIVRTAMRSE